MSGAPPPPDDHDAKKQAMAGQWRTPPLPVFPSGEGELPQVNELPDSTEDYAKALQEAYRRGAEAAAAMAAARGSAAPAAAPVPMASTVSCPDFSDQVLPPPIPNPLPPTPTAPSSMPPPPPPPPTLPPVKPSQRSMSLPDMTSYGAQQEEEKRQKRLARNRASARLRRLRKKNLVDAYETEVGILEKTLAQLSSHEWGQGEDHPRALVEALSMDRGQQVLTKEERQQAAADILQQQIDFVAMLEASMQEQYVLSQVGGEDFQDLAEHLQLTPQQVEQLQAASAGWQDEWNALQTVKTSLLAMRDNGWLWNEGSSAIAEEFLAILHKNQVSKFLLWADHNVEAIDELDGIHAPSSVASGPIFHFGVNSNPETMLEEEKAA